MKAVVIGAHLLRDDVEPVAVAIPVGDLFLSAIEVADDQPLGDRELLLRVAETRGKLLEVATFVAIRYGFAVSGDALPQVAAHLDRWRRLLTEHRHHVEMTLKVAAASPGPRPDRHAFTSGADYLRALHASMQAANVDPAFHEAAERLLIPLSVKHRWIPRDEKSVELALLIESASIDAVEAAGTALRESNVPFLLSGPWPLEVFADDHQ